MIESSSNMMGLFSSIYNNAWLKIPNSLHLVNEYEAETAKLTIEVLGNAGDEK